MCVWLPWVGVALWPQSHCSSWAMDSGPERKAHTQSGSYDPTWTKTKSSFVQVNLICAAAPCALANALILQGYSVCSNEPQTCERQPWWAKNKMLKMLPRSRSLPYSLEMCLIHDAQFNCENFFYFYFFRSLSHLKGLRAVTDDTTVATSWFLWEAIRVVCLLRAVPG